MLLKIVVLEREHPLKEHRRKQDKVEAYITLHRTTSLTPLVDIFKTFVEKKRNFITDLNFRHPKGYIRTLKEIIC